VLIGERIPAAGWRELALERDDSSSSRCGFDLAINFMPLRPLRDSA
jgi:hypothetical protein